MIEYPVIVFEIPMSYVADRRMHTHDSHEFFFLLEGGGEQITRHGSLTMRTGDVFFFPAGEEHIGNGSPNGCCLGGVLNLHEEAFIEGCGVVFRDSREVLSHLVNRGRSGEYRLPLTPNGRRKVFALFREMLEESRRKHVGFRGAIGALLHQMLTAILRNSQMSPVTAVKHSGAESAISDTMTFLRSHFSEHIDVDRAARMANMSRSYFHASFRNVTGTTYVRYLNGLRVENAVRLLKGGGHDAKAAATLSGFRSLSHFYKVFREISGGSPKKIDYDNEGD
ncbi:MAG: helix-turn-helix domain-containing protein [Victivallales bacterium]|nr:helix-turn-helix domain-containing protein [Victivallales bacterium]